MLTLAVMVAACGGNEKKELEKKGSSGKTLEILLVADHEVYNGDVKDLIDSLFRGPQPGFMNNEPKFDVVNIPVSSFNNSEMFRVHRNVLKLDINPENPNKVYMHRDAWAAPQIVFDFAVKDRASLDTLLIKYYDRILQEVYRAEHARIIKAYNGQSGYELRDAIRKQFGFDLAFSNEFRMANVAHPSEDFAWVRKEAKDFSIGVLVKVMPYTQQGQFEEKFILDQLDTMMRQVGGPADSSYMGTERRMNFVTRPADMQQSSFSVETRGCWRLFGDFMGGPFVNYTLLSPDKKQVIMLCAYTYCPRFDKRDYLMQVESVCHSIAFEKEK